jgi:hypothetical protein
MLTQNEENEIRDTVRRSLDSILAKREGQANGNGTPPPPGDAEHVTDAKRIIGEETERYYQKLGLVKHVSRGGQVFWVTPAEAEKLQIRRKRQEKSLFHFHFNRKVALVWGASILVAALLVVYLLTTVLPQLG